MTEYIEREAVLVELCRGCSMHGGCDSFFCGDPCPKYERIAAIPAADVQPVRHGRWIQHYEPYDTGEEWIEAPYGFECSECGRWEVEQEPFCNCGAKMQGDANGETD